MVPYPMLFGALLLAAGVAAVVCALYTVHGNYRPAINRAFFATGFSLLLWSLGLALRVLAADEGIAVVGSLIAPAGYGMMFGFLLHYILLLTGRQALLKKWHSYLPLYLPGLISIFGLTVLPLLGYDSYELRRTPLGWVNDTLNIWVVFYYVYYAVFLALSLLLLLRWERRSGSEATKKQARLLMLSLLATAVLGTLTDVLSGFLDAQLPGMAVIFSLLPILAISYSVHRFGFMRLADVNPNEIILDRPARSRMYDILALAFIGGSIFNTLGQQFIYQGNTLPHGVLFSIFLLAVGGFLLFISRKLQGESFRELLVAFVIALVIPIFTLRFYATAGVTLWVFVFLLLVCSVLFNQSLLLVTVLMGASLSQLLLWAAVPDIYVPFGARDYVFRLLLLAMAAFLGYYVNRVYLRRLRENAMYAAKQQMISDISHSFIAISEDNFHNTILNMLERCGGFLHCDCAYVALLGDDSPGPLYTCEWRTPGAESLRDAFAKSTPEILAAIRKRPEIMQPVVIDDTQEQPAGRTEIMPHLLRSGVRGLVVLPVALGEKIIGFISFAGTRPVPRWNMDSPMFLSILANMVADAAAKLADVRQLHYIAYHDQLTGLPNRFLFKDRLSHAIPLARRTAKVIGIVFLDLDSFKSINDTMGHELGDRILVEVSRTLRAHVRGYDTIARFGGDEFVLLLDQLNGESELITILEKLMAIIQKPILLDGQEFFLTGSAGAALFPQDGEDVETLLKNADIAMYHAKGLGKNRYSLCTQHIKDHVVEQMKLVNLLYRAQEKGQFLLYYQPQISLETKTVVGLEALIRWTLPERGMIGPATFIPLAEQTGLIQSIGAWVLQTACAQCKRWQEMGLPAVRMAVNISLYQLNNKGFVQQVADVLRTTGLAPEYLELEVVESVANSGDKDIVEILTQLKGLGISLSIDDFGTEYSSLSRLKQLPVDRLKLDMQFVQGIESSEKDRAITKVIISLAKSLNMKVIAEGVETAPQLDFLIHKLCDEVQGYFYYKPMPADEVEKMLRASCAGSSVRRSVP